MHQSVRSIFGWTNIHPVKDGLYTCNMLFNWTETTLLFYMHKIMHISLILSPWYNCHGRLCVKNQLAICQCNVCVIFTYVERKLCFHLYSREIIGMLPLVFRGDNGHISFREIIISFTLFVFVLFLIHTHTNYCQIFFFFLALHIHAVFNALGHCCKSKLFQTSHSH